jgi:hypothetical protein
MKFKKMTPMSKLEEVEVWNGFVDALPEESYLKSMLRGLQRHLYNCMMNDISENVADILEGRDARMVNVAQAAENLGRRVAKLEAENRAMAVHEGVLDGKIENLIKRAVEAEQSAAGYRGDLQAEGFRRIEIEDKLMAAERQIVELKAQKFDELFALGKGMRNEG